MSLMTSLVFFSLLILTCISQAQERAPHGLSNESPMAFSPAAIEFFHPKSTNPKGEENCIRSNCSPLPMAAKVISTIGQGTRVGVGPLVGIGFAFVFIVISAIGVFYVLVKRRANLRRENYVKPGV